MTGTDDDKLNVWHQHILVGELKRDPTGKIGFTYDASWQAEGFRISQQLPLSTTKYEPNEAVAHQFFANLLPEGETRTVIAKDLKISNTDFELLKAIGGECAGALSILPASHQPDTANPKTDHYRKLDKDDFDQFLTSKGQTSGLTSDSERPRLSLAGAQTKCPVYFDGQNYFLSKAAAASTHIIKFDVANYPHIPAYEYFLTKLAKAIGLPAVNCELIAHGSNHFLLVERYDRIIKGPHVVTRLHQEDFCQALGTSHEKKYETDGGPTFADCFRLVQNVCANPIADTHSLLKWQMFNLLAGNSDGHTKNLSLVYRDNHQPALAPFYDLVCTRAIERIDAKLAFSIGGQFEPGQTRLKHWAKLAADCGVQEKFLNKLLAQTADQLLQNLQPVKEKFFNEVTEYPALQQAEQVIKKQCARTLKEMKLAKG